MQAQSILPDASLQSVCVKLPVALRRQPGPANCSLGFAPVLRQARLSKVAEQGTAAHSTQLEQKCSFHSPRRVVSAASSAPAAADQATSTATPAAEQPPSAPAETPAPTETPAPADTPAPAGTPAPVGKAAPARTGRPAATKKWSKRGPAATPSDKQEKEKHNLPFEVGDILVGTVVRGSELGVHVKLSNYEGLLGWVPNLYKPRHLRNSFDSTPIFSKGEAQLPNGLQREWKVMEIRPGQKPGQWYPRLSAGQIDLDILRERCTQIIEMSQKEHCALRVVISGTNAGGLTLLYEGLSGFIPLSALVKPKDVRYSLEELKQKYMGKELEVYLTEVKTDNMTVVMNQRAADLPRMERKCRRGTLHWGTIDHIAPDFGAYVLLDDPFAKVTGMLHISAISQEHVDSVDDVFKLGERVRVMIKDVRPPGLSRINVATHVLEKTPGQIFTDKEGVYANGDAVQPVFDDVLQTVLANRRQLTGPPTNSGQSYAGASYGQASRSFGGPRRDRQGGNDAFWNGSRDGGRSNSNSSDPDDSFWDPM